MEPVNIDQLSAIDEPLTITNPLAGARTAAPTEVIVEGSKILWRIDDDDRSGELRGFDLGGPANGALWNFIRLCNAAPTDFADFARRYGVLAIRTDGLPGTSEVKDPGINLLPPFEMRNGQYWYVEDMEVWRSFAVGLKAIIVLAHETRVSPDLSPFEILASYGLNTLTWETFGLPSFHEEGMSPHYWIWMRFLSPDFVAHTVERLDPEHRRAWIASFISRTWVLYARLTPVIRWENGIAHMHLSLGTGDEGILPENSLFSILAAQLAAFVTSPRLERMAVCSKCGEVYEALVRPGRHANNYCSSYCKAAGKRDRNREWAHRKALGKMSE